MDRLLESAEVFFITHVKSNHPTLDSPFQASKFDNVRDYGFLPIRTTKKQIDSYFVQILQFFVPFGVHFFLFTHDTSVPVKWQPQLHKLLRVRRTWGAIIEWTRWSVNHHGVIINNRQQKRCAKSSECPPFPASVNKCQPHSHFIFPRWFWQYTYCHSTYATYILCLRMNTTVAAFTLNFNKCLLER